MSSSDKDTHAEVQTRRTWPCKYLCTSHAGGDLVHLYATTWRRTTDSEDEVRRTRVGVFCLRPEASLLRQEQRKPEGSSGTVSCSSASLWRDDVAMMDNVTRLRSATSMKLTASDRFMDPNVQRYVRSVVDPSCVREMFLTSLEAPLMDEIVTTLCLSEDLADPFLEPSMSGAREDRLEGLRRVLPTMSCFFPVVQEVPASFPRDRDEIKEDVEESTQLRVAFVRDNSLCADAVTMADDQMLQALPIGDDRDHSTVDVELHLERTLERHLKALDCSESAIH